MSLYQLHDQIDQVIENFIEDANAIELGSKGLKLVGLDFRCGRISVSIEQDFVFSHNSRSLEYYGGWEYIDSEFKTEYGDYTFYDGEASRVASVIEAVKDMIDDGWVYDSENLTFVNPEEQLSPEEQEEQLRRDEKNGLYPDKWDDAN